MARKKTHKQIFGAHPVPGQSRRFVYVYVFFLSLTFGFRRIKVRSVILAVRTVHVEFLTIF